MRLVLAAVAVSLVPVFAADLSPQILAAAAAGRITEVQALLDKGAPVDAQDRNGRTPLMLAAQHGHADTVRLLLTKGAHADTRDKSGFTAYGLALLEPVGRLGHAEALQALPQSRHPRIAMDAEVAAGGLISSCFMPPGQLKQAVTNLDLDAAAVRDIVDYSRTSGKGVAEIVQVEKPEDADVRATVEVQPGAACVAGNGDSLNIAVNVRVYAGKDRQLLQEKRFAGGFKGLRKQTVENAAQYGPVYLAWIKPQAGPIYWFIVETVFRTIL